jgi:hypothetical protein
MTRKNVKIPKASVTKLAKAYAQVMQRRREEEAILALGPSLEALSKSKPTKRKRRVPLSPVRSYWRPRKAYEMAPGFVGPLLPSRGYSGNEAMDIEPESRKRARSRSRDR